MFYIRRVTLNPTGPTFGVFLNENIPLCVTLELPWKDNQEGISCIPPGVYPLTLIGATTELNYPHFAIENVPGRTNVRIHVGNTVADVRGCACVGECFGTNSILNSVDAMNYIRKAINAPGTITIVNPQS